MSKIDVEALASMTDGKVVVMFGDERFDMTPSDAIRLARDMMRAAYAVGTADVSEVEEA